MDEARKWTDRRLIEMEAHLRRLYKDSYSELSAKWHKYMEAGQARLDNLYNAYLSAPADKKAEMLLRYQNAMQSYTLRNQWYQNMVNDTAYRLAHVNEMAISYINGEIPDIYLNNFNYIDPEVMDIGINWTLRNEHTIKGLILDTLPSKELNYPKDVAWNRKQINSSVLQGILQGESINKIADRLMPIVDNNRKAATRTARTMVTGAENRGRQDRYEGYENEGIVMTKVWIATPDGHTRDWHLSMDGQEVGVDEAFTDGLGNSLEYPGDPSAPAETVYNCRCAMRSSIKGIRDKSGIVRSISDFRAGHTSLHQEQMAAEKEKRGW